MAHPSSAKTLYRGRFAPSPTGLLHLGSLVAALGSYLDAKANGGEWLLRIEDLDPPREEPHARDLIPKQLETHGLEWDQSISYQSDRTESYRDVLSQLAENQSSYPCSCSRQRLKLMDGVYDRRCLKQGPDPDVDHALRLKIDGSYQWKDLVLGACEFSVGELGGDFVVHRRDGLYSYQLAVAVDDHNQGISHVIRGADLLDSTARQGFIMQALNWDPPSYGHLPVVIAANGQKLSKQNLAPTLDPNLAADNLFRSLQILGQNPPADLRYEDKEAVLRWAVSHWRLDAVPKTSVAAALC